MTKRLGFILAMLFLLPIFSVKVNVAYADAILEPEDSFYRQNRDKMEYSGRIFVGNGKGGYAIAKKAPDSGRTKHKLQNGESVSIDFTCLYEGEYWGYAYSYGWFKMKDLYGSHNFEQENKEKLYIYNGDYAEIIKAGEALLWHWPGTDTKSQKIEKIDMNMFTVHNAYTDEQGREWGKVGYYFGRQDRWVCMSDPTNSELPAFNPTPETAVWVPDKEHTAIPKTNFIFLVIAIMATVLLGGTVVLIKVFGKKRKNI